MKDGPDAAQLLADADWLKRLAIRLAGDPDDADDLVQESRIAAWLRQPDESRPIRPWLAKVVRDLAFMKRRADRRRLARDTEWEGSRQAASSDELLEQLWLHRLLVDLVLHLDEPYRSTIIARFVEGRSAADLARSLGIPESTVRGRLRDGLARLRAQLDERHGDRRSWSRGVLAFAKGGIAVAKPSKAMVLLLALLALLLGGAAVTFLAIKATPRESPSSSVLARSSDASTRAQEPGRLDALMASGRVPGWIAQAGVPDRRVAGRVLVEGVPTGGVLVSLTSELSLAGLVPAQTVRTDASGAFDFGPQPGREVVVSAAMPGKLAAIQRVDLRDPVVRPDHVELALTSCVVALYGRVLDAVGGPIAHARLLREDVVGTETDASGAYELCVLPLAPIPEQLLIVVRADGYGAIAMVAAPAGRVHHDFVLTPEATITGVAVGADGAPVPNAKVWAEPDDAQSRPIETTARTMTVTDEQGRFQLFGLAGGRHRVAGLGEGVTAPPLIVFVEAGESRQVTLQMLAIGIVRGRVVRGDEPVPGARVAVVGGGFGSAVSQTDGSFVLDGVPVGDVRLTAAPYRVRSPASIKVVAGDNAEVTLSVEPLGRLHGTVTRRGIPVPEARVSVFGPSRVSTNADANGRYELAGLEPGEYALVADDARLGAFVDGIRLQIGLAEARQLDVELISAGRIAGVVVDREGAPVEGAHVRLARLDGDDGGRCVTDKKGAFECGMLSGGTYEATVYPSAVGSAAFLFVGPAATPIVLPDRDSRVDGFRLVVDPVSKSIQGVVVNPAGDPIPDARVQVVSHEGEGDTMFAWMAPPAGVSSVDGSFRIDGLAPGTYSVVVRTRDGAKSEHKGIEAGTLEARLVIEPTCGDDQSVLRKEPDGIQHRPAARVVWDGRVELVGWSAPDAVRTGVEFDMAFYYRVLQPTDRSWKTFVHVDGASQRLSADHEPLGGRCPMASWKPGDYIVDRFTARFDDGYEAGTYTIWTGFYVGWAGRWINMAVSEAPPDALGKGDRVKVTSIVLDTRR